MRSILDHDGSQQQRFLNLAADIVRNADADEKARTLLLVGDVRSGAVSVRDGQSELRRVRQDQLGFHTLAMEALEQARNERETRQINAVVDAVHAGHLNKRDARLALAELRRNQLSQAA